MSRSQGIKQKILAAASTCFERLGLEQTRVEDILSVAQISRATFYRHFANMDAVLVDLAVHAARDAMANAVASCQKNHKGSVAQIAHVIAAMAGREIDAPILKMIASGSDLHRLSNIIIRSDEAMQLLAEPLLPLLAAGHDEGTLRADLSVKQMVEWLTRLATSIRTRPPPWARTVPELEKYVMQFVMPGLLAQNTSEQHAIVERLDAIERHLRPPRRAAARRS